MQTKNGARTSLMAQSFDFDDNNPVIMFNFLFSSLLTKSS